MKKLLGILVVTAFLLFAFFEAAHAAGVYFTVQGGTGTSSPSGILYGDNGATSHLNTVGIGKGLTFTGGTLSISGGSGTVSTSSSESAGYFPTWTSTNGTPALLAGKSSLFQDSMGDVGVGTIFPNAAFHIATNTTDDPLLLINGTYTENTLLGSAGIVEFDPSLVLNVAGSATITKFLPLITTNAAISTLNNNNSELNFVAGSGNINTAQGQIVSFNSNSAYTGTLTLGRGFLIQAPVWSSGQLTTYTGLTVAAQGIASSTIGIALGDLTSAVNNVNIVTGQTTSPVGNFDGYFAAAYPSFFVATSTLSTNAKIDLASTRSAVVSGNVLGTLGFVSNDTNLTTPGVQVAGIAAVANTTHTVAALGTDLTFSSTNGTTYAELARLTGTGNFGIGTTSPYGQLALGGGNLILGAATAGGTPGDLFLPKLGTAAGAFLAVDVAGKIIATTTPSGSGAVSSVSNSDGTLTISPTTGAVVASIALSHANTWTGLQQFNGNASTTGISVTGTASSTRYIAYLGTAANPSYTFSGDEDTGIYTSAANTFAFTTAGVNRLSISASAVSFSNIVGYVGSSAFAKDWEIKTGTSGTLAAPTYAFNSDTGTGLWSQYASALNLAVGGTEVFRSDTASTSFPVGNLGVGTTSPYSKLSIGGNVVVGAATAGGTLGDLFLPKLGTAAGAILAVDSTGKVIATSTPSAVTSIGPAGQLQIGPILTLASTTDAATGLTSGVTITATGNVITFKPTLTGTLAAANGGTGATSLSSFFSVVSNVLMANEHHSFTYGTSTAWTGTTTIPLEIGYGEVWKTIRCYTDVGTLNTQVGYGSASTTMFNASTTVGIVAFSANNTMTAGNQVKVDIGTPASSPTKITCTEADQF